VGARERIKDWWKGTYVPHENEPGSSLVFVGGETRYHWTARVCRAVLDFMKVEWKFVATAFFALMAMGITLLGYYLRAKGYI
jgi:hypothetical protein